MGFEVFTKRMARAHEEPYVTIQKKGVIAFNHAAFDALGEPQAVVFLFDRQAQVVGFRPAKLTDEHAYPVRANTRGTSHLVSGILFTKHYGIPTDVARRWRARSAGDGILTINLGESPVGADSAGGHSPSPSRGRGGAVQKE